MEDFAVLLRSQPFVILLVALAVVLFVAGLLLRSLRGSKGDTVLLLGASNSGKTTLFYQLRDGSTHQGTVPSMQANEDRVELPPVKGHKSASFLLVDVPGHPKVRGQATGYYRAARCIIFMVDAVEFLGQKAEVAEQLYEVLGSAAVQRHATRVLLACNKADLGARAHTPEFVRKRLEKQLDALRATHATLGEAAEQAGLPCKGSPFTFDGMAAARGPRVSVTACSAQLAELDGVLAFLRTA